jgi:hypothetical protein
MKTIIATLCVDPKRIFATDNRYFTLARVLLDTYLKYTDFSILIVTNNVKFFDDYDREPRVIIVDFDANFSDPMTACGYINMNLKRLPIKLASQLNFDIVYHNDCDCFITGWDDESYAAALAEDYEFYMPTVYHEGNRIDGLRLDIPIIDAKIKIEYEDSGICYPDIGGAPHMSETRILFKNNDKMKLFVKYWDRIASANDQKYRNNVCYATTDGVYFGTCAWYAKMKIARMNPNFMFTNNCRIHHGERILDYYGCTVHPS